MTMREFEVWLEGYRSRQDSAIELLAWVQANLINIHIPKGKPRVTPKKLLPKGHGRKKPTGDDEPDTEEIERLAASIPGQPGGAKARVAAAKARLKAKREVEEERAFWSSPEGQRIRQMIREEDG
jgi:hypothetical protein